MLQKTDAFVIHEIVFRCKRVYVLDDFTSDDLALIDVQAITPINFEPELPRHIAIIYPTAPTPTPIPTTNRCEIHALFSLCIMKYFIHLFQTCDIWWITLNAATQKAQTRVSHEKMKERRCTARAVWNNIVSFKNAFVLYSLWCCNWANFLRNLP